MTNKELLQYVMTGGLFTLQYGRKTFVGDLYVFSQRCKDFIDYKHKPNSYFGFSVYVGGHEYTVDRGFKPLLLRALSI